MCIFSYSKFSDGNFKHKIATEIIKSRFAHKCVAKSREKGYVVAVWDEQEEFKGKGIGYLTNAEVWCIVDSLINECLDFGYWKLNTARFTVEYKKKAIKISYGDEEDEQIILVVERDDKIPFISNLKSRYRRMRENWLSWYYTIMDKIKKDGE